MLAFVLHATLPVLEVCCLGSFGVVLAKNGILSPEARTGLTKLVYYLFVPALISTKLLSAVELHRLVQWWPLLVNCALSIAAGLGLGRVMAHVTCASDAQRPILVAAAGLGNAGNIPLVLLAALMREGGLPSTPQEEDLGVTYVVLGMMVAALTHYTIGSHLLRPQRPAWARGVAEGRAAAGNGGAPAIEVAREEAERLLRDEEKPPPGVVAHALRVLERGGRDFPPHGDRALLLHPGTATPIPLHDDDDDDSPLGPEILAPPSPTWRTRLTGTRARLRHACGIAGPIVASAARDSVSPPTIACLLGLVAGLIPPLKALLLPPSGPLATLTTSLSVYGECAIPAMMLLLGATLHTGPGGGQVAASHIMSIVLLRQLLLPLMGAAAVITFLQMGVYPCEDPAFLLTLLLQHTTPTAVNVHALAVLHQNGERELGVLLFWQYVASLFTLPVCLMLYLRLVDRYCPVA